MGHRGEIRFMVLEWPGWDDIDCVTGLLQGRRYLHGL